MMDMRVIIPRYSKGMPPCVSTTIWQTMPRP